MILNFWNCLLVEIMPSNLQMMTKIYGLTPEDCNPEATTIRRKNLSLITKGLKDGNNIDVTEIDHSSRFFSFCKFAHEL